MDDEARQLILDTEHLRLLRIGYFISAGVHALIAALVIAYFGVVFFIFTSVSRNAQADAPPPFIGPLIGIVGLAIVTLIIGMGALQFFTGQRLKEHRSRLFCMIIAALTCLSFPFGTFLGVCTFIVLGRPSVERTFS